MPITANDIKLLESERMADTTDGGGRRTSRVIVDGAAGNIFPKVSRLDSVYGRVNLRKVYGAVQTADVDTYAGSHAIITDAPDNAKIHCTLFSTASEFDTRSAARDRIESFVTSGPESRMTLLGRQLSGQQSITAYQRTEEPLPEIGEVFCLSSEAGSVVTAQQYFRIETVDAEIRTFTESVGGNQVEFKRRVLTLGTGVALRYEFNGPENATQLSTVARPSKLRSTTFVDAARYFGIRPLAQPAAQNDLSIKVDSVYTAIVPTTNRETPLSNVATLGAAGMTAIKAGTRSETLGALANGASARLLRGAKPGTLGIYSSATLLASDDKLGQLDSPTFVGTVDYTTGLVTRTGGSASGSLTATYTPAVSASQVAHTRAIPVDLANRGTVYALTLLPLPVPGATLVDYRALGKWYRLRDLGDGSLAGDDPAYGTGRIDYATGAMVLTLGALPDIDSALIVSFGSPAHYVIRSGVTSNAGSSVIQRFQLPDLPVAADSVGITYTAGGVQYTGTDNATGQITGNGLTGSINYTTGQVELHFTTRLPDALSSVAVTYDQVTATVQGEQVIKSAVVAAAASIDLDDSIVAGTLNATIPFGGKPIFVRDNGAGLLVAPAGQFLDEVYAGTVNHVSTMLGGATTAADSVVGSIDYGNGILTINAGVTVTGNRYSPASYNLAWTGAVGNGAVGAVGWSDGTVPLSLGTGSCNIGWKSSGVATSTAAKSTSVDFITAPLRFALRTTLGDNLVPDSILLAIGGKIYIDRNGTLYADVSAATGAGTTAGSLDYATGEISLSFWANNAAPSIAVECCLSVYGEYVANEVYLRTGGSPIRPASFYVQASALDGTLLSGTADNNGTVTGTKVQGAIDQDTGVVIVRFGQVVTAAGNESAEWFSAANVVGGQIWKPEPIIPSTLRYNAVVLSNLPLNADILGLDPVRLPSDGRVPIYRPADVVVIHNTATYALPNPAVAGAVYNVGRTNLSELWLVDQAGTKIPGDRYVASLTAGTITMAADLVLTGYTQPLIAHHRVEDLALLSDVQINGQLGLTAPLTRAYTAGNTFVSSAVLFGDMNARVTDQHDLLSFTGWSDTPGAEANAEFNNIDYPVEVLNNGAVTERWRINFTSTTAFQVVGENLGVIATGTTAVDCSPSNALTGQPYFVIRAAGWGAGWSAGNQLRFNTASAAAPIWIARTVLPGATLEGDSFSLQLRGDVDA